MSLRTKQYSAWRTKGKNKIAQHTGIDADYYKNQYAMVLDEEKRLKNLQNSGESLKRENRKFLQNIPKNLEEFKTRYLFLAPELSHAKNQTEVTEAQKQTAVSDYLSELRTFTEQLQKTKTLGSTSQFKELLKTSEEKLKALNNNSSINEVKQAFAEIAKRAVNYQMVHIPGQAGLVLKGQMGTRLKLCNRILMINQWCQKGVLRTTDDAALKLKLAEKIVSGTAMEQFKERSQDNALMKDLFFNTEAFAGRVMSIYENPEFGRFCRFLNYEDPAFEQTLRMKGEDVRKAFDVFEARSLKVQRVAAKEGRLLSKYANEVPAATVEFMDDEAYKEVETSSASKDSFEDSEISGFDLNVSEQ